MCYHFISVCPQSMRCHVLITAVQLTKVTMSAQSGLTVSAERGDYLSAAESELGKNCSCVRALYTFKVHYGLKMSLSDLP